MTTELLGGFLSRQRVRLGVAPFALTVGAQQVDGNLARLGFYRDRLADAIADRASVDFVWRHGASRDYLHTNAQKQYEDVLFRLLFVALDSDLLRRPAAAIRKVEGKRLEYRESVDNPPYRPAVTGQMDAPF